MTNKYICSICKNDKLELVGINYIYCKKCGRDYVMEVKA